MARGKHVKVELKGMEDLIANLNKEIKKLKDVSLPALLEAVEFVHADMLVTSPTVPKDTGNLRASWTTNPYVSAQYIAVKFGFTANYALWVHEMVGDGGKEINWNEPGSGPKFMEEALKRNEKKILEILGENTKIE